MNQKFIEPKTIDKCLTSIPEITFFEPTYSRYKNFSNIDKSIQIYESVYEITKTGDIKMRFVEKSPN